MEQKERPYSVIPYNPKWKKDYEKEREILKNIFKKKALMIEHIGSTSIKGMWAKPQIDILVVINKFQEADNLIKKMESKGYTYQKNYLKNQRYFARDAPTGERLTSIHILKKNNPEVLSDIYFRDYLRKHPEEIKRYSKIKKDAYKSGINRAEYPKRKREIIKDLLEKAKKEFS